MKTNNTDRVSTEQSERLENLLKMDQSNLYLTLLQMEELIFGKPECRTRPTSALTLVMKKAGSTPRFSISVNIQPCRGISTSDIASELTWIVRSPKHLKLRFPQITSTTSMISATRLVLHITTYSCRQ